MNIILFYEIPMFKRIVGKFNLRIIRFSFLGFIFCYFNCVFCYFNCVFYFL